MMVSSDGFNISSNVGIPSISSSSGNPIGSNMLEKSSCCSGSSFGGILFDIPEGGFRTEGVGSPQRCLLHSVGQH